jgi:hypothetical protein
MMNLSKNTIIVAFCAVTAMSVPTMQARAAVALGFSFGEEKVGRAVTPGFSFGEDEVDSVIGNPCYEEPACDYQLYYEPVYIEGAWYRGPMYYRWYNGVRLFWYHGAWRSDEWIGPRPTRFEWRDWREHGEWRDGWRGDREWRERTERERLEREGARDREERVEFEGRHDRDGKDRDRHGRD